MKKLLALPLVAVSLLLVIAVAVVSASTGKTIRVVGSEDLKPNILVSSNFRFSPGPAELQSGEMVTWVEETGDGHTLTLATSDQLVQKFEDLFPPEMGGTCPACVEAINAAVTGHLGAGLVPVLDPDGDGQFDSPGDSMLLFPGASVSAQINVPAGTTLYYFCAFHPWMQGTIVVQ